MARANSQDVATHAGVSIATVSHVINGTRYVSDETRQKVLDAIRDLNYRPNAVARGLATSVTRKIGLVVSEIRNPFFTDTARGIEDELLSQRYNLILCNTDENSERESAVLHLLGTQQVDGIIIAPTGEPSEALLGLVKAGVPIVQIDRRSPGLQVPLVGVNNEEGAYQAIRYLIELGHQRIACLINLDVISTQTERLHGWERALREAGLPVDEALVVRGDPRFFGPDPEHNASAAQQKLPGATKVLQGLLNMPQRPSAIFVASNQLTLGTLYAFRDFGIKCPEDISLISFDDHDWAPIFNPPLTVMRQPTYQLGRAAAQLLMRMINNEMVDSPPPLKVELVKRASCAPVFDLAYRSNHS